MISRKQPRRAKPSSLREYPPDPPVSWDRLVESVARGEASGLEELYGIFSKGIRYYFWSHLGIQDVDDRVHDAFLIVVDAIQKRELREPERLMGFIHTVLRRMVATQIGTTVSARRRYIGLEGPGLRDGQIGPEAAAIQKQHRRIAVRILATFPDREREVLVRFYLREQTVEQICKDLGLTSTQFRLLKSRAKARFGELGKAQLARRKGLSDEESLPREYGT